MTTAGGKLARDSLWMVVVQLYGKGLTLLFSLYAASALGVEKFGIYGYVMAIVTMIAALADFGANTFQVRQTAITIDTPQRKTLLTSSLTMRAVLGLVGLLLILFLSRFFMTDRLVSVLLVLFGLGMFFNNISGGFSYTLIGLESFGIYGLLSVVSQTFNIGAACLLIYLGLGLLGIGYAFSVWGLVALVMISIVVSKKHYIPVFNVPRRQVVDFLKGAAPIGLTALLSSIYYKSDYVILEYFRGEAEVGLYNAAYVIVNALIFLPTTISTTFLPRLAFLKQHDPEKLEIVYRHIFKYLFFAGFGLGFGTLAVSADLVAAIYPAEFAPAHLALSLLIWALSLIFINSMQGHMLVAIGKQNLLPYITGAAAVTNIVLNLIVIPVYGMRGAAVTTVVAEIVAGASSIYFLRKYNHVGHIFLIAARTAAAGIVMLALLMILQNVTLFVRVPVGIIVYFAVLVFVGGITATDLAPIREILKRE
jgi:O-antigen/teichoic acid export membrane protein